MLNATKTSGSISILVLIFGVVFSSIIGGLAAYGAMEHTNVIRSESYQEALHIAEAGLQYYRWVLAHDPDDYQDGTGEPGPYVHSFTDPQSGVTGSYSLSITPPEEGSTVITVESTGWSDDNPLIKRTIKATFGPIPLTRYSFLHNSNVWFGHGMVVYGEVFSNGGIRMDGINESRIMSSKETYTCGTETGCTSPTTRPGVWGNGGPEELWTYPVPVYDFDSIVTDFAAMKQAAQAGGQYFPPVSGYGYHFVFRSNGMVDVYRVNSAQNLKGWDSENGCVNLYQDIKNQTFIKSFNLEFTKIIFVEDTVWVDGVVNGQTTLVAARLPVASYSTDIWINGDLTYLEKNGQHNLGLVAQRDIIMARNIPNKFEINAAMLAQKGRVMRHHYNMQGCSHSSYATRNELVIYGSVISNLKSYWNFATQFGPTSGFTKREIIYNQDAADTPPPYFPYTGQVRQLSWDEIDN